MRDKAGLGEVYGFELGLDGFAGEKQRCSE